ncbi:YndJ family transporter [Cellulomonas fimi]|uniref:YndJ family transporter n=1 Tax=Cellulomonas fimi TaxID=1708 RepID=UPI00234C2C34|nr:YndJ family transporter [Cellulomonas fimi]MDC7122652.1 YndJ family transporter [Cellulomonas fimi]
MSGDALGAPAEAAVHVLVGLGATVVLPLGLRLLGPLVVARPGSLAWPLAGLAAAVSVWLPVGPVASALSLPFAVASAVLAVLGVRVAVQPSATPHARVQRGAVATALVTPAIGAAALVAERAGWGLLGFGGTYLTLTVPHMLFAGFGACLVAGLVAGVAPGRPADVAAVAVPVGVLLVLAGYFVSDAAELLGAVVLTAALWCAAAAVLRAPAAVTDAEGAAGGDARRARVLLRTGAVVVVVAMLPALWWAAGESLGLPHPGLDVMVATHGVANALGFVVCTLVGLAVLDRRSAATTGAVVRAGVQPAERAAAARDGAGFTYDEVGATLRGVRPAGYRCTARRWRVAAYATAEDAAALGDDLLAWRIQAAAGVRVEVDGPARPGVRVVSRPGVGPLRLAAPCVVVAVDEAGCHTAFAYGTLPGHPFRGEELFAVERDTDGAVWFVVEAFSLPAVWWARAAWPLVGVGQHAYARMLAAAARRLHRERTASRSGAPSRGGGDR